MAKYKHKITKRTLLGICLVFSTLSIFILVTIGLIPLLISTEWGKGHTLNFVSKKLNLKCEAKTLSLKWQGPQKIEGLICLDEANQTYLTSPSIETDASLWSLLFRNVGELKIASPVLAISQTSQHLPSSLPSQPAGHSHVMKKKSFTPPFNGHIVVEKGAVTVAQEGTSILFQDVDLELTVKKHFPIAFSSQGNTSQDNVLGRFSIRGAVDQSQPLPHLDIATTFKNFPVKGIDEISSRIYPELKGAFIESIGTSMDLSLTGKLSSSLFDFSLFLESEKCQAQFETQTNPGFISLKREGTLRCAFSTLLAQRILSLTDLKVIETPSLHLALSDLHLPYTEEKIDFSSLGFKLDLTIPSFSLESSKLHKPFTLNRINGEFASRNIQQNSSFKIHSSIDQNPIQIEGKMQALDLNIAEIRLNLDEISTSFLDDLFEGKNLLTEALGPTLSAQVYLAPNGDKGSLTLRTPKMTLSNAKFEYKEEALIIDEPAKFTYLLTEEMAKALSTELTLKSPTQFNGVIQKFKLKNPLSSIEIWASVNTPFIDLDLLPIRNFNGEIAIEGYEHMTLKLKSDQITTKIVGALGENSFQSKEMAFVDFTLSPQEASTLLLKIHGPVLLSPAQFRLMIQPFSVVFSPFDWKSLKLKGDFSSQNLSFERKPLLPVLVEEIQGKFFFDGEKKSTSLLMSSEIRDADNTKGTLGLTLTLNDFILNHELDYSRAAIDAKIDVENFRLRFLEAFFPQYMYLEPLIGPTTSFHAHLTGVKENSDFSLKSSSALLTTDIALNFKEGRVGLQRKGEPLFITWRLTPAGYVALDKLSLNPKGRETPYILKEDTKIVINIPQFSLNLSPNFEPNFKDFQIKAESSTDHLDLVMKNTQTELNLKNLKASIFRANDIDPLVVTASVVSSVKGKNGSLEAVAEVQNLNLKDSSLELNNLKTSADIKIQQFPTYALDFFARLLGTQNAPFSTLFGHAVNGTIHTEVQDLNGDVNVNLYSSNTRGSLKGHIKEGVLYLKEPLHAQLTLTEALTSQFLKEINPLSITSISSKNPLTLEIPKEGVAIPLYPFSLERMQIPEAKIELGQIICKNEGNINIAMGLLKAKQLSNDNHLNLWFAPIVLHINRGVIDLERTEILIAETYDIALWGKLNLINDNVDMVLGLTSDCLKKAFKIKKLPKDYVLHIPLQGTTDNVQINTSQATTKIALLMAWEKKDVIGGLSGGFGGIILGEVVGKVVPLPDENAYTPPAKRPYPWELTQTPVSAVKKKPTNYTKKAIKPTDKPLKQLMKILLN